MASITHHWIPCSMCGARMLACYNMESGGYCRAWLCESCGYVSAAIGRERKFKLGENPPEMAPEARPNDKLPNDS